MTNLIGSKTFYGYESEPPTDFPIGYKAGSPIYTTTDSNTVITRSLQMGGARRKRSKSKKKTNKKSKNNRKMRFKKKSRKHRHTKYCKHNKKSNKKHTRKYKKMRGGMCGNPPTPHYNGGGCGCMTGGTNCPYQSGGSGCGLFSSTGFGLNGNGGGEYGETASPMPYSEYNLVTN